MRTQFFSVIREFENECGSRFYAVEKTSLSNAEAVAYRDDPANHFGQSRDELLRDLTDLLGPSRLRIEEEPTYKVLRKFHNSGRVFTIKTGLSLALAQEHCSNPETSSSTCTGRLQKARTRRYGPWFDEYTRE